MIYAPNLKPNMAGFSVLKRVWKFMVKSLRLMIIALGIIFLVMIILSFTRHPYMAYHYLGTANSEIEADPDFIVVMGADGMPGQKSLLRCTYAAMAAKAFPKAKIIIAMPANPENFLGSDPHQMFEIIQMNGIAPQRFRFEYTGTNTITQACGIRQMLEGFQNRNLLIVSSPDHMYRSILTFEKCGFKSVDGWPAFGAAIEDNLLLNDEEKDSELIPLSRNISLRYNMWTYLKLEIDVFREWLAIAYYKFKGYI